METKKRNRPVGTAATNISISGFDIRECLGAGGMAVVWKAYQTSLERMVAIKVLRSEFAADPDEVRRFMDEARSAAKLSHPNIVQVYDTGSENGVHYIVMEYVAGNTVGSLLRAHGAFSQKEALQVAVCVAEALDDAWRKAEIVHRDIKPDNIMFDNETKAVKVSDLGLARVGHALAAGVAERETHIEGTPNFMAPEQVGGYPADCRSDIYSLGATLYHMVTGCLPFDNLSDEEVMRAQCESALRNPRDIKPRLSIGISQLLTHMMMKQPEHRPADWPEALREIKRVASGRVLLVKGTQPQSTIAKQETAHAAQNATVSATAQGREALSSWRALRILLLILVWAGFVVWMMFPFFSRLRNLP